MNKNNQVYFQHTWISLLLCLSSLTSAFSYDVTEKNVDCGLHEQVIKTSEDNYIPYYVKLFRCLGKDVDTNPHGKICLPTTKKFVEFTIQNFDGDQKYKTKLENHTSCKYSCRGDNTWCSRDQVWNADSCSCCDNVQPCEEFLVWDERKCMCICPNTSTDNCLGQLKPDKGVVSFLDKNIRMKYVWTIAAAEGLLLVTICFLILYFFCRGKNPCASYTYTTQKSDDTKRNSDSMMSEVSFSKLNSPFNKCERNGFNEEFSERERFLSF